MYPFSIYIKKNKKKSNSLKNMSNSSKSAIAYLKLFQTNLKQIKILLPELIINDV